MHKKLIVVAALVGSAFVTGCVSVPMASPEKDSQAKSFAVKADKSNIYVYRNESRANVNSGVRHSQRIA